MKKNNKLKIKINGKIRLIKKKTTLKSLLTRYKLSTNKVAIELNHKIVDKKKPKKIDLVELNLRSKPEEKKKISLINKKNTKKDRFCRW